MAFGTKSWAQGYDVGHAGASSLLSAAGVEVVWAWKKRERNKEPCYELVTTTKMSGWQATSRMCPTRGVVGATIAREAAAVTMCPRWRIAQEAVFLGKSPKSSLAIGWGAGALLGPVERYAVDRRLQRIQPGQWRAGLFGIKIDTKSDKAKEVSLRYMPPRLPGLAEALQAIATTMGTTIKSLDHVTDSAGVAEFCQLYGDQQ